MEASRPLLLGVVALSLASATLSVIAFTRSPAGASGPLTAGSCDEAALRRDMADLRKDIDSSEVERSRSLALRLSALERLATASSLPMKDADKPDPNDAASSTPTASPRVGPLYTKFDVPNRSIAIRQEKDGSLAVTNSDPELSGKTMIVTARADDGSEHQVAIVVPAPAK